MAIQGVPASDVLIPLQHWIEGNDNLGCPADQRRGGNDDKPSEIRSVSSFTQTNARPRTGGIVLQPEWQSIVHLFGFRSETCPFTVNEDTVKRPRERNDIHGPFRE